MGLEQNEGYKMLVDAILSLENEEEVELFLEDLMTRKEILDAAQRMLVAKLLSKKVVYSKIAEETGASTATISRVNHCLKYGSDGYHKVLQNMKLEEKRSK